MKKLRIALLSVEYPPDPFSAGIGSYTQSMATALTEKGHKVYVLTRGEKDSIADEAGISVERLTPRRPALPHDFHPLKVLGLVTTSLLTELQYRKKISQTLERLIKTSGIDLIEAPDFMAEAVFYAPKRHPLIPFIVRLHTPFAYAERIEPHAPEFMRQAMRQLERRQLCKAHFISAASQVSAEIFRKEMNLGDKAIHVIPNLPSFKPPPLEQTGSEAENTVVFVGRLNKWKGSHILSQAIPTVLRHCPEANFLFVGADHVPLAGFPNASSYLKSLVPEYHHKQMHFTGHVSLAEVQKHLQKASLCVFPSLFESFGYTCLEAMSYGKAIIGSTQGGMVDLLDHGNAGLLYSPPDSEALAKQIIYLLQNPKQRAELGKKARERSLEAYNPQAILDKTLDFYHSALASLGSGST